MIIVQMLGVVVFTFFTAVLAYGFRQKHRANKHLGALGVTEKVPLTPAMRRVLVFWILGMAAGALMMALPVIT